MSFVSDLILEQTYRVSRLLKCEVTFVFVSWQFISQDPRVERQIMFVKAYSPCNSLARNDQSFHIVPCLIHFNFAAPNSPILPGQRDNPRQGWAAEITLLLMVSTAQQIGLGANSRISVQPGCRLGYSKGKYMSRQCQTPLKELCPWACRQVSGL